MKNKLKLLQNDLCTYSLYIFRMDKNKNDDYIQCIMLKGFQIAVKMSRGLFKHPLVILTIS